MVNGQQLTGQAILWSTDLKRLMSNVLVAVTPCSFSMFPLMYCRGVLLSRAGCPNYIYVDTEVTRENKKIRDQIPPHNNLFLNVITSL
jgi:hypothetical protein